MLTDKNKVEEKYRVVELLSHPHFCVMDANNEVICWCVTRDKAVTLCALLLGSRQ